MPVVNNTSYLGSTSDAEKNVEASTETMVEVNHVSMVFNIASEQLNSLKEYAIALSKRELHFKEFRALDDVSLEVKRGDVFGILGTNGSGKSTLLKIIAGVLEPTKGTCTVNGDIAPLIELGAGFDMELTARENIFLNGALLGYSKQFIRENFDDIVDFAEVRDFLDMPMKNYSSGMVARIAFAIATVIVPEILIVDEVLSVGDFMFQQKCERRIQSLIKDHGVTVLIVSHNNDQIERLCNKAVWIEKGHLRIIGDAKEVCHIYRVVGGRPGKPESEQLVLKRFADKADPHIELCDSLFGDNRFSTAAKVNDIAEKASDTVVLVNNDYYRDTHIACSLAGLFDASVLATAADRIPDVTMRELQHLDPSRIFAIGSEEKISTRTFEELSEAFPAAYIQGIERGLKSLGNDAYALNRDDGWSDTMMLISDQFNTAALAFVPYVFSRKIPVFYRTLEGEITEGVRSALAKAKRIIVFATENDIPDVAIRQANTQGEILRFDEEDLCVCNDHINAWIQQRCSEDGTPLSRTLIVAAPDNLIDNFAASSLSGRMQSLVLFEDPQNLDSIAHAINYVDEHADEIDRLLFIGDRTRFNDTDKALLGKGLHPASV